MEKLVHRYNLDGLVLDVPLKKRKGENGYIEDCSRLIDHPQYTPNGHPVILTNNEACELYKDKFSDCEDCDFFKKADVPHFTLIGICTHESHKKQIPESGELLWE